MPPQIIAQSLSSITTLAENPPLDYRDPVESVVTPLTLYIARVPGSRDVFLTTLKPREKVVTAYDLEGSLYYCHVDNPDDEVIRRSLEKSDIDTVGGLDDDEAGPLPFLPESPTRSPARKSPSLDESTSIPKRKALPPKPQLPLGDRPIPPPKLFPHLQFSPNHHVERSKYGDQLTYRLQEQSAQKPTLPPRPTPSLEVQPDLLPRKVLQGPRPLQHSRLQSVDSAALTNGLAGKENVKNRRWSEQPEKTQLRPSLPLRPSERHRNGSPTSITESRQGSLRESEEDDAEPLSITIIRRNPSTGEQWNIGKIRTLDTILPNDTTGSGLTANVLAFDLTQPGYSKFVQKRTRYDDSSEDDFVEQEDTSVANMRSPNILATESPFTRHIRLPPSRPLQIKAPSPRRRHFGSSLDAGRPGLPHRDPSHTSPPDITMATSTNLTTPSNPYTFLSPWNTTCTLSTGATGRALKCKHQLPLPTPSAGISHLGPPSPLAVPLSELRFNLPRSSQRPLFRKSAHSAPIITPQFPRRSQNESTYSSESDNAEEEEDYFDGGHGMAGTGLDTRMDLSLGQERAGGGSGGKRAKLGKIIIEREGLKMLDFVVMANLGVWWRKGYERR
ncbi:hypothetical protein MMC25_002344 [Agyrium rufum]|nr:hypothetical protein [Agyrium rufum]